MKAIKIIEGHKAELQKVPVPKLRDDYVLCKVKCIALNPTDWKHIDRLGKPGSTVGVDFILTWILGGVVEEVGAKVSKKWQKGDRIAGFCHGGNESQHEDGAFGEYCLIKGDLGLKIPDSLSDEEAATLGAAVITCGQALCQRLGIPLPGSKNHGGYLLVYGGSTATGTIAIQYGILSGCKVIATASQHNWPLLKSLGVEQTFDYKVPTCAENIRSYTNDKLALVMDCIAEGDSPTICENAVSSQGGTIAYLLKTEHSRKDVENIRVLGYTVIGEAFDKFGTHSPASPEDFEHSKIFCALTDGLLQAGKLKAHPLKIGKEGLKGAFDGFQQFREGKISGVKLVYRVDETA